MIIQGSPWIIWRHLVQLIKFWSTDNVFFLLPLPSILLQSSVWCTTDLVETPRLHLELYTVHRHQEAQANLSDLVVGLKTAIAKGDKAAVFLKIFSWAVPLFCPGSLIFLLRLNDEVSKSSYIYTCDLHLPMSF